MNCEHTETIQKLEKRIEAIERRIDAKDRLIASIVKAVKKLLYDHQLDRIYRVKDS